eukprot:CAMPEP_0198283676 /NCGR_PEP_ID=MMETSP1449-20131203/3247_1 /TAXON_ID=420275 /ORGANISM="Attheya septentrionalis, Strain CCMP2084" /LENGTH=540 /DNA_ID=CAMNT_0043980401 /DNA_START=200 /DNA_END=1818 /DNA_ORIENTATION=+
MTARRRMQRWIQGQSTKAQSLPPVAWALRVFLRLPKPLRLFFIIIFVLWKIIVGIFVIRTILIHALTSRRKGILRIEKQISIHDTPTPIPIRVLYTITSPSNRWEDWVLPVVQQSIQNMIKDPQHYHVDLFIILGYPLDRQHKKNIQKNLPEGTGLQFWSIDEQDSVENDSENQDKLLALARHHRYVIKDNLEDYDFFLAMQDDIHVTATHMTQFRRLSQSFQKMAAEAASKEEAKETTAVARQLDNYAHPHQMNFYGDMSSKQLDRLLPGFLRVKLLTQYDEEQKEGGETSERLIVKADPYFENYSQPDQEQPDVMERHFDPEPCCHFTHTLSGADPQLLPISPHMDDVGFWDTHIEALGVRQLPLNKEGLDWITLQPKYFDDMKSQEKHKGSSPDDTFIGAFWSGRNGTVANADAAIPPTQFTQAPLQGGWMASREQILQWNNDDTKCQGNLLPPFLDTTKKQRRYHNPVDFWLGGGQLFAAQSQGGCALQHAVSLNPDDFSNHTMYHITPHHEQSEKDQIVRADTLFGQLNAVRKKA